MSRQSQPIPAVEYQDSTESCLRDFLKSFYEGPFAVQQGAPPRITGTTQYLVTDLLHALSICQVNTARDLMAMVRHPAASPAPPPPLPLLLTTTTLLVK